MPLVSVIIPNYNHAKYLKQRIDSVLNQTFQDFEVIILDDCSTDDSREVIEQYRNHPKISNIVYNRANSGSTFKQWKKGIDLAKGEYIWIAESDDWCELNFLDTVLSGTKGRDDIAFSYAQSYMLDDLLNIKWVSWHTKMNEVIKGVEFIQKYMVAGNKVFNASMVVFRKKTYNLISDEYLNYKFCGDWMFWILLATHDSVHISGKVLNYFRKHDNDVSGRFYGSGENFVEELNVLGYLKQSNLIAEEQFVKMLHSKYEKFRDTESRFAKDVSNNIQSVFTKEIGGGKYGFILRFHYFKIKIKRHLVRCINKILCLAKNER